MTSADRVVITSSPPPGWEALCRERNDLFHSAAWQEVLRIGFRCTSLYLWAPEERTGIALPIFGIGPLRIAYLGFPAGGQMGGVSAPEAVLEMLPRLSFTRRVDAVRVPISAFAQPALRTRRAVGLPETAIIKLTDWNRGQLPGAVRRDLKKFSGSELELRKSTNAARDSSRCHRLYLDTIRRHRGKTRYTQSYFHALIELSQGSEQLRCMGAYLGDDLAGYLVAILSGRTVYYLHGATEPRFRNARPSDALLCDAIEWAQDIGATRFNMMTSPRSQPGLVFYKEKWGGETGTHRTCTIPVSWFGRLVAPLLDRGASLPVRD